MIDKASIHVNYVTMYRNYVRSVRSNYYIFTLLQLRITTHCLALRLLPLFKLSCMAPAPQKILNLLLADDDKDDRFFFEKALAGVSIPTNLTTVTDGGILLEYLYENLRNPPDVLFLDLNMPCKNGIECLTEIKHHKELKKNPVVIYSTSVREEVADILYKRGAHYYAQKCNFNDMARSIEDVLIMLAQNPLQPARDLLLITEIEN